MTKTVQDVLAMAGDSEVKFMAFRAAAAPFFKGDMPQSKTDIVAALEKLTDAGPAAPEKRIEVMLLRKYAPEHLYEIDGQAARPVLDGAGNPVRQDGIFQTIPAGVTVRLPADEAKRALAAKSRIAQPTERTFD